MDRIHGSFTDPYSALLQASMIDAVVGVMIFGFIGLCMFGIWFVDEMDD